MATIAPRQLLTRFFKREARRLGVPLTTQQPSTSSSSPSTSVLSAPLHWEGTSNPFNRRRIEGRPGTIRPLYSLRRQKQLLQAASFIKLEDTEAGSSADGAGSADLASWSLPKSRKEGKMQAIDAEEASRDPQDVYRQGPYKGRLKRPTRGHIWERKQAGVRADRQEKLANMPARIAEFTKARAAAKASTKPGLPF